MLAKSADALATDIDQVAEWRNHGLRHWEAVNGSRRNPSH
jgi:hypothetical protein